MNSFCGQLTVLAKSMQQNVCYVCLLYICVCVVWSIYMAYIQSGLYSTLYSDISGAKCEHQWLVTVACLVWFVVASHSWQINQITKRYLAHNQQQKKEQRKGKERQREIEGKCYKQQFSSSRIVTTQLSPSLSVYTVQRHVACHNAVIICHFDTMPTRSPPNQVPLCEAPLEAARARLAGSIEIMTF